ncbi:MAG: FAD-binding domain-containing protein [Planctomycetota bacterium]|nr:FAD-binding domain-containing protein [Planctomycetota bacterium]
MSIQLVWFKRDLRIRDHLPLVEAGRAGPCLGLYVYEPELLEAEDADAAHLQFINESLRELRQSLRSLGSELLLRRGRMPEVLEQLCREVHIAKVWAHEETHNGLSYQRDRRVRAWLRKRGIPLRELSQYGVIRRLENRDGWSRQWAERMNQPLHDAPGKLEAPRELSALVGGEIQTDRHFRIHRFPRRSIQQGGEEAGQECLKSFLETRGMNYRSDMASPLTGEQGCSRLSPYLSYGNLSMRTVHQSCGARMRELRENAGSRGSGQTAYSRPRKPVTSWLRSLSSFRSRLSWHCHFMQKIEDQPSIEYENFNRAYDGLREEEFNEDYFQAWCEGRTGFPMVDACMRALQQTGWINFRMRAMLVSFASYQLWLHWRRPSLHLARLFLDYEPGIHYSQVQMQSGVTGINTVRIYSPIKQVADQDPRGEFIRRYLPELLDVPDKHLAEPHLMNKMEQSFYGCRIGQDYPFPIVDHRSRYQLARERIHQHKRLPHVRKASEEVYWRHGSRKTPFSQR